MLSFLGAEAMPLTADADVWRDVVVAWLLAAVGLACLYLA